MTTSLTRPGSFSMTQEKATYLLKTVWPQAPQVEVIKASMICATYGLNPLLKQVSLIKFKTKSGGESWVTVLGIKASRNIALATGHKWGYVDGPRVMSEAEQKQIFGQVDADKIWAITRIKDDKNNEYPGYGFWPRASEVYGSDKGNSAVNMAFIRSERNALDKMAPGELPDVEAIDESLMPAENFGKVIEQGKAQAQDEARNDIETLYPGANEAKTLRNPLSVKSVGDLYNACMDDFKLAPADILKELNYQSKADIVDPAECYRKIAVVR